MKIRTEISDIETKKTIEQISETRTGAGSLKSSTKLINLQQDS